LQVIKKSDEKKWGILFIGSLVLLGIATFSVQPFFHKHSPAGSDNPKKKDRYFVPVSIIAWTPDQFPTPCISIQVEDQTISASLDLGFKGFLSVAGQVLDRIENKTFVGSQRRYGFRGKEYQKDVFEIPNIQIGLLHFSQIPVQKEAEEFHENSLMSQGIAESYPSEEGRIGWETCRLAGNLLLDLHNGTIAFCDSLETLKAEGYEIESFIKTPLLSDRGFIEFLATMDSKTSRCILDTGSTWNCLHIAQKENESMADMLNNPAHIFEMQQFRIENQELGPLVFHEIPIELPIHVDALLGMDFFLRHLIFVNFTNKQIYFKRHE